MSILPSACRLITVALLMAGTNFTFSPWALNKPCSSAMKKPAESTAGTTATVRSGFSTPGVLAALPPAEHPPATSTAAITSSAVPRTPAVSKPRRDSLAAVTPPPGAREAMKTPPAALAAGTGNADDDCISSAPLISVAGSGGPGPAGAAKDYRGAPANGAPGGYQSAFPLTGSV